MLIGYARVSTEDQHLDLQRDALARAGCGRSLEDRRSGAKTDRPGLLAALDYARPGDCVVVWRLDRLGRSLGEHARDDAAPDHAIRRQVGPLAQQTVG